MYVEIAPANVEIRKKLRRKLHRAVTSKPKMLGNAKIDNFLRIVVASSSFMAKWYRTVLQKGEVHSNF
jgi:hypothetical protein